MHMMERLMARTKRAQILMEPDEYQRLEEIASVRGCSVAQLIRLAVKERYLVSVNDRLAAVEALVSMELPIGDWDQLKAELEEKHGAAIS